MATKVVVEGADELARTLRRAGADIEAADDADRAASELIAQQSRARAPKRTGRLAASVDASVTQGRATVSSALAYSAPIHWGWRARSIEPNRFMLEAAEDTERQWLVFYDRDVQQALDRVKAA